MNNSLIIIMTMFFLCSETSSSIIIASIENSGYSCVGVILPSHYVLTAAHCVHGDFRDFRVYIQGFVYGIKDVKFHPGFDIEKRRNDDIAIIILDRDIKLLDGVKFANISSSIFNSQKDTVYITDSSKNSLKITVKVDTTTLNQPCLLDSIICTVGYEKIIISGYPLVIDDESNSPNVIGIGSFYYRNSYIFSRVSYYHDWIMKIIKEDDLMMVKTFIFKEQEDFLNDRLHALLDFIFKEQEDFLNDRLYALLDFIFIPYFPFLSTLIGVTFCIFLLLTCPMFKNKKSQKVVRQKVVPKKVQKVDGKGEICLCKYQLGVVRDYDLRSSKQKK